MIVVEWANTEKNIVIWRFPSQWSWDDFYAAKKEVDIMIDGVEGIVDSIFLTSKEQKIPSGAIAHLKNIITQRHERHEMIILVGSKMFLSALLNLILKFVPSVQTQLHYVITDAEAYAIIEEAQQRRINSLVA